VTILKMSVPGPIGVLLAFSLAGCASPYHSDQGALFGGLLGAGTGAVVGHALGSTAGGALVGAGVGALGGAAIGAGMDETEARNRAMIEQQLGRQVAAGAVTIPDVVNMTRARVTEEVIMTHLNYHGLAAPLQANDIIYLRQQGVSDRVIQAMQATAVATVQPQPVAAVPVYAAPPPPGIIIEERWGPPYRHYRRW
jgi:hypothetical protein